MLANTGTEETNNATNSSGMGKSTSLSATTPMPISRILQYSSIKAVKDVPRVSQDLFFRCLGTTGCLGVLEEFSKQVKR